MKKKNENIFRNLGGICDNINRHSEDLFDELEEHKVILTTIDDHLDQMREWIKRGQQIHIAHRIEVPKKIARYSQYVIDQLERFKKLEHQCYKKMEILYEASQELEMEKML